MFNFTQIKGRAIKSCVYLPGYQMTESFANSVRECVGNKGLSFIGASSLEGKLVTAIKIKGISFTSITKTSEMNMLVLGQAHSLPGTYPTDVLTRSAHTHTLKHTHGLCCYYFISARHRKQYKCPSVGSDSMH